MIDQQCKADQEKFNKIRLLLVCNSASYKVTSLMKESFPCLLSCALSIVTIAVVFC